VASIGLWVVFVILAIGTALKLDEMWVSVDCDLPNQVLDLHWEIRKYGELGSGNSARIVSCVAAQ
jgi:hypothetical protein